MRRFPISWDSTLARLGFKRKSRRVKRDHFRRKQSRIESLEVRAMLSGNAPEPIRPEFTLVSYEGLAEGEVERFVVSTEYESDGTPVAVVGLNPLAGQVDYRLHELELELRLGQTVLESQEVAINLTNPDFEEAFYKDRVKIVAQQTPEATVVQLEAWRDELGVDGVFASIGSGADAVSLAESVGDWQRWATGTGPTGTC